MQCSYCDLEHHENPFAVVKCSCGAVWHPSSFDDDTADDDYPSGSWTMPADQSQSSMPNNDAAKPNTPPNQPPSDPV